jgi:hypothetical protein
MTLAALALAASSKADLIQWSDTGQTEYKLYNKKHHDDVTSFTASIGKHKSTQYTALIVTGPDTISSGAGYANIKPDVGNLTSLTITPSSPTWFSDFVFRGQLEPGAFTVGKGKDKTAKVTLDAYDQNNKKFELTWSFNKKDKDFSDIGVMANSGSSETISKIVITATGTGFKDIKQLEFSLTKGQGPLDPPGPVPEPSSLLITGLGVIGFVGCGLRLRKRK